MTDGPKLLDDQWFHRDLPVLVEVLRRFDAPGYPHTDPASFTEPTGLDQATVEQALKSLERANLISTEKAMGGHVLMVREVSGSAHTLTGLWPDERSVVARLIDAIEQAMETATPERRTFLQRARDNLAALPQDAALAVGAALLGGLGG